MTEHRLERDLEHVLEHTGDVWEQLRGARLFITGGTGFIGCWLLESLTFANEKLGLDISAVVLTRDHAAFYKKAPHLAKHPSLTFHAGDIRNFKFPEGEFSHVIHTPGQFKEQPMMDRFDLIVGGAKRALEFAAFRNVKNFLLVSSGVVYGAQPAGIPNLSEDYRGLPEPMDPGYNSTYGLAKLAAEHACVLHASEYGMEPRIARCFTFVGPYLPLTIHYAIGNFIGDGLAGNTIKVRGDGTACRAYLYAADLAIWLWTILVNGRPCRPYNVGSEEAVSIAELAKTVAGIFDDPPAVEVSEQPVAGKEVDRYVPSVARAAAELGLRPMVGLEEAVRRTAAFNHPFDHHGTSKT